MVKLTNFRNRIFLAPLAAALMTAASSATAQSTSSGPDVLRESYGDWIVQCETRRLADTTPAQRVCELMQQLTEDEKGQRVLTVAFQTAADDSAAVTLIAPFGLRLSEGISVDLNGTRIAAIPFRTCLPVGCIATDVFDQTTLSRLTAAELAQVVMVSDGGQSLSVPVSLDGLSNGWSRLIALGGE